VKRTLERYFDFETLGTNWRTEILAGATTFVTMAYIVFVNPSILKDAGISPAAATAATCLSAAFGSLLMGAVARYPIALAPGMGLNAYFTYTVVQGMGVSWQVALGAVFLSGVAFLALTLTGVRQRIVECIPRDLYAAIAAGIGLFIAFVGLKNAGLIAAHPATLVELGKLSAPQAQLALLGLAATAGLLAWRVPGAILLGVLAATVAALATGIAAWSPQPAALAALPQTALQLDIPGALALGAVEIVFVFLFVDLFDNVGTLVAVGKRAGLIGPDGRIPRVGRILVADATATVGGSLLGTSTVVSYIESAAGVAAGGRSGVTAIVAGLLFLVALAAAPLAGAIPAGATAPALIVVGSLMMKHAGEIEWDRFEIAIPAFLTIALIPLSFSIANGIAFGLIAYVALQALRGRAVNWFLYLLTGLCIVRFAYLGRG